MNNEQLPPKEIYCTKCQKNTPHQGSVDDNGEFVFHCTEKKELNANGQEVYHHFVKFPADTTPEQFAELIKKHEDHNAGQVHIEKQNEKLRSLLSLSLKNTEQQAEQAEQAEQATTATPDEAQTPAQ